MLYFNHISALALSRLEPSFNLLIVLLSIEEQALSLPLFHHFHGVIMKRELVLDEEDIALRSLPDKISRPELLHHVNEESLHSKNLEIGLF